MKWKRKNVDWKKFKEEINKLGNILGNTKEEILENIYKKMRHAGERSVGYTKGRRRIKDRIWWNKDIKVKRKERKIANKKRRQLEIEKERKKQNFSKNQQLREAVKEYRKKKSETQNEIKEAMKKEEKRKLIEIKQKRDEKEWWNFLKEEGEYNIELETKKEIKIEGEICTDEEKIKKTY